MKNDKSRITHLNNEYTEEKLKQAKQKRMEKLGFKRRITAILSVGAFFTLLTGIPLARNVFHVHALEQDKQAAVEELEEQTAYNEELEYYTHLLQDEEYVAKLARSEYYLTQDDEIVFSLPEDETPEYQEIIEEEEQEEQKQKLEEK